MNGNKFTGPIPVELLRWKFAEGRTIELENTASLAEVGLSAADAKRAGFSAADLKEAGFSATDLKQAGFPAADIFPLCKDERRQGAQGVFYDDYGSEFGTLYYDGRWRPNGPDGNLYWHDNCRVLEW